MLDISFFPVKWYAVFKSTNLPKLRSWYFHANKQSFQLPLYYFHKLCLYTCHMPEHIFFNGLQLLLKNIQKSHKAIFSSAFFGVSFLFSFFHPQCKELDVMAANISQVIVCWCTLRLLLIVVLSIGQRLFDFTSSFASVFVNLLYLESVKICMTYWGVYK